MRIAIVISVISTALVTSTAVRAGWYANKADGLPALDRQASLVVTIRPYLRIIETLKRSTSVAFIFTGFSRTTLKGENRFSDELTIAYFAEGTYPEVEESLHSDPLNLHSRVIAGELIAFLRLPTQEEQLTISKSKELSSSKEQVWVLCSGSLGLFPRPRLAKRQMGERDYAADDDSIKAAIISYYTHDRDVWIDASLGMRAPIKDWAIQDLERLMFVNPIGVAETVYKNVGHSRKFDDLQTLTAFANACTSVARMDHSFDSERMEAINGKNLETVLQADNATPDWQHSVFDLLPRETSLPITRKLSTGPTSRVSAECLTKFYSIKNDNDARLELTEKWKTDPSLEKRRWGELLEAECRISLGVITTESFMKDITGDDTTVSFQAIEKLQRISPESDKVKIVKKVLESVDSSDWVKELVLTSLTESTESAQLLETVALDDNQDLSIRKHAVWTLDGFAADQKLNPALTKLAESELPPEVGELVEWLVSRRGMD